MTTLAVIFDFDDTLAPDTTSALLRSKGIDPDEFWTELAPPLVADGYDPPLAFLRLLLERIGEDKPLGPLTNDDLRAFGATLDETFFPGLPDLFDDLRDAVNEFRDTRIEFHIVSGGLEEIIGASAIVRQHFAGYYGCLLGADEPGGVLRHIKRCISFTEKTRYLFEIAKGIPREESRSQPHLVNQRQEHLRVPFDHMIYVGDGLTDIPCFSLVGERRGKTFGVFKPGRESAKQAFQKLLDTRRVESIHSPDYREDADLGALIRAAVTTVAANADLQREHAFR